MSVPIKLAVAAIAGAVGLLALVFGWSYLWLGIVVSVGLVAEHARRGGVAAAFAAFKRGDMAAVRDNVRHTWWPRFLSRRNQAYQYWMEGMLLAAECRFPQAREKLLIAASGAIQTENDRSLIQCLLAEVSLQLNDLCSARDHLSLAKRLRHPEQVDRMIAESEERLRSRNMVSESAAQAGIPLASDNTTN